MPLKRRVAIVMGAMGALGGVAVKILLGNREYVVSTYGSEDKHTDWLSLLAGAHGICRLVFRLM